MSTLELQMIGAGHTLYLAAAGGAMWSWLRWVGAEATLANAVVCSLPAVLGLALTFTSVADEQQYVLRLAAAGLFAPILLLFWGTSVDATSLPRYPWAFGVGAAAFHAALFAGSVMWVGTHTTRIAADAGVPAVGANTLQARLLSLNAIGGPLQVTSPAANELIITYRHRSPDRSYRVLLNLDPTTRRVRVRERTSANMAKPATESERSMRMVGDATVNPSRPDATSVSETVAQVTPVKAARLRATPNNLRGDVVEVPASFAAALDEEGVLTLLCAVSVRSGWDWRPAFFGASD